MENSQNSGTAAILADPQVQEILRAKQEGRQVQVVNPQGQNTGESVDLISELKNRDDLEDMSGKDMLELVGQQMRKMYEDQVKPLSQQVQQLNQSQQAQERERLKQQVEQTKQKYSDFDDYKESMLQIHQENPGLGVEELYVIAKQRAGKTVQPPRKVNQQGRRRTQEQEEETNTPRRAPGTSTERPVSSAGQPSQKTENNRETPRGQRGFNQLLNEALENVEIEV